VRPAATGKRRLLQGADGDPLSLLVGLFDGALVLALALGLQTRSAPEASVADRQSADPVPAQREQLPRYRPADGEAQGDGSRLGIAYRLASGDVVFVPDASSKESRTR